MAADRTPRAPHEQYRLADIPVDDAWVRKHNESLAEVRRLQWSAGILGVLVLGAAVGLLIYSGFEAWAWIVAALAGVFALGCLAMIGYIPRKMGSMQRTYATSELVPAIIAEKLPGHDVRVGERVPCVAVVGNRSARGSDNLYQFISPMPVAWATSDKAVLRRLEKEIPSGEWERVRQNLDRVDEVSATPTSLLPLD